jgi:hypothetical protein
MSRKWLTSFVSSFVSSTPVRLLTAALMPVGCFYLLLLLQAFLSVYKPVGVVDLVLAAVTILGVGLLIGAGVFAAFAIAVLAVHDYRKV